MSTDGAVCASGRYRVRDVESAAELSGRVRRSCLASKIRRGLGGRTSARSRQFAARASGLYRDVRYMSALWGFISSARSRSPSCRPATYSRGMFGGSRSSSAVLFVSTCALSPADPRAVHGTLKPNRACVSMVEGWRGEICHVAAAGSKEVLSPECRSLHSWTGLALALRDRGHLRLSLCNKSFDLRIAHDLNPKKASTQ
jgi:hypothetical protein